MNHYPRRKILLKKKLRNILQMASKHKTGLAIFAAFATIFVVSLIAVNSKNPITTATLAKDIEGIDFDFPLLSFGFSSCDEEIKECQDELDLCKANLNTTKELFNDKVHELEECKDEIGEINSSLETCNYWKDIYEIQSVSCYNELDSAQVQLQDYELLVQNAGNTICCILRQMNGEDIAYYYLDYSTHRVKCTTSPDSDLGTVEINCG